MSNGDAKPCPWNQIHSLRALRAGPLSNRKGHYRAVPPRLYIETTIPSYLVARRSRDLRLSAHQEVTGEWWTTRRHEYELYISDFVLDEAGEGDPSFAAARLSALEGIPSLEVTEDVDELAARFLDAGLMPTRAAQDAFHIAISAVHGIDFLLTWNCKHINNVNIIRRLESICAQNGFACPVICSPDEMVPSSDP